MQHIEEIEKKITQHKTYGKQAEGVASAEGGLFFITFIRKVMKIKNKISLPRETFLAFCLTGAAKSSKSCLIK